MNKAKKSPRILLVNDDGIHAPGLEVLERIARTISDDIWTVAPMAEQSGASNSITISKPLTLREFGERRIGVNGTPSDCVLMAIEVVMRDTPPDLVLSGVNAGANVAEDILYSGTIAAAMEATLFHLPAIAFSQSSRIGQPIPWATAEHFGKRLIPQLASCAWYKEGVLLNVNFPYGAVEDVKGVCATQQGFRPAYKSLEKRLDPRGNEYYWIGAIPLEERLKRKAIPRHAEKEHTCLLDREAISGDEPRVSITPLHLNLTAFSLLETVADSIR